MKKMACALFMSAVLLVSSNTVTAAAITPEINITLNGQPLTSEVSSYIENGTTFVPLSVLQKLKGLSIQWMEKEGTVRLWIDRGGVFDLKPGTAYADDWGVHYPFSAEIRLKEGNVMLPLRFIAEMTGADVTWDKVRDQVNIVQKRKAIAAVPGTRNRLYPVLENNREYKGIQLEWDGMFKAYPWVNPSSISSPPQLFIEDINEDGQLEAIIILSTGSGTGIHLEELHVIDRRTFKDVPVEDPLEVLKKRVQSSIDIRKEDVVITTIVNGKKTVQHRDITFYGKDGVGAYEKLSFGAVIMYGVRDKKLIATLGGASSISNFEGDIEIEYTFVNGQYAAKSLSYFPLDE